MANPRPHVTMVQIVTEDILRLKSKLKKQEDFLQYLIEEDKKGPRQMPIEVSPGRCLINGAEVEITMQTTTNGQ